MNDDSDSAEAHGAGVDRKADIALEAEDILYCSGASSSDATVSIALLLATL